MVRTPAHFPSTRSARLPVLAVLLGGASVGAGLAWPSAVLAPERDAPARAPKDDAYRATIRPLLQKYCFGCHGEEKQKGSVRLDNLDPDFVEGFDAEEWHFALDMIQGAEMPPSKAPQLSDDERRALVQWIEAGIEDVKRANAGPAEPVLRRLNRRQFTNTLQDLFGLDIDFGRALPGDAKSRTGFTNNGDALQSSPLHIDTYYALASQAAKEAIVTGPRPKSTRYLVTFGKGIGKDSVAASTGGYQSVPLGTNDFGIELLGHDGEVKVAATKEEQDAMDRLREKISVGLRGSSRDRFQVTEDGLVLYGAVPHREVAPGAWQGPSPNAKLEMQRVFPEQGRLAMRVTASRGKIWQSREPVLLPMEDREPRVGFLGPSGEFMRPMDAIVAEATGSDQRQNLRIAGDVLTPEDRTKHATARVRIDLPKEGFYQVDLVHPPLANDAMPSIRLERGKQTLDVRPVMSEEQLTKDRTASTIGAAYLKKGGQHLKVGGTFFTGFSHLILTPLEDSHGLVKGLEGHTADLEAEVADRHPVLRAFAGTRTDDGMDYATFGEPIEVTAPFGQPETHTFYARLENLPVPEPESGDNEILSGFLLLGVWNDHLVKDRKQSGPPLLVESIEIEAPYFETWPPASHQSLFIDSPNRGDESVYGAEVIGAFLDRAFRRPVDAETKERYVDFWRATRPQFDSLEESIQEVVTAALCSPRFLYIAEPEPASDGALEGADDWVLASRLSYFLWNSPPDEALFRKAAMGKLRGDLAAEARRMLDDPKAERFIAQFAEEWLRLDRFDQMTVDPRKFPGLTRFVKRDMRGETIAFLGHVLGSDLPAAELIDSDFVMLNQNLAEYYGVPGVRGPHLRPVTVPRERGRGGLLSQGAFLAGHSDGIDPHPIKRAVWLKEKFLGDPPPPPPPNVPDLDPTAPGFQNLTLKEQLEKHRDSASCFDCHAGIDPWGLAFERYGAGGLLEETRKDRPIDAATVLPDGTAIDGVRALKDYLLSSQQETVARSLTEHLFAYALGRDVSFTDEELLDGIMDAVRADNYRLRSIVDAIVTSPAFAH